MIALPTFTQEGFPIIVGLLVSCVLPQIKFARTLSIAAVLGASISLASGELSGSIDRSLTALLVDAGMSAAGAAAVIWVRRIAQQRLEHK